MSHELEKQHTQSKSPSFAEITKFIHKFDPTICWTDPKQPYQGATTLFLYNNVSPKSWRIDDETPQEAWITLGDGWATVVTIWDETNSPDPKKAKKANGTKMTKSIHQYQKVLDWLNPSEESGWHRCATKKQFHSYGNTPDGMYKSRWAKHLTKKKLQRSIELVYYSNRTSLEYYNILFS